MAKGRKCSRWTRHGPLKAIGWKVDPLDHSLCARVFLHARGWHGGGLQILVLACVLVCLAPVAAQVDDDRDMDLGSPSAGSPSPPKRSVVAPLLSASVESIDRSTKSALYLMKESTRVRRNGQHHVLQRALRQLRDPQLQPFFSYLADGPHADLQIHGILGLAESSPQRTIDLVRIATIKSPAVQADLISHAMDNDLLTTNQAMQMLQWGEDVDLAVKVLISAHLIGEGSFEQQEIVAKAMESENLARRSLAALLILQTGDQGALEQLGELDASKDEGRDKVRGMLLRTASKFDLDKSAPWAIGIAQDSTTDSKIGLAALHVALKFGAEGAEKLWRKRFSEAADVGARTRLALMSLQLYQKLPPSIGQPLRTSDEPLLAQIGAVMKAIQSKVNVGDEVIKLIQMNHPRVTEWALHFARDDAEHDDAMKILAALIGDVDGPTRNLELRLDHAMAATQILYEKDVKIAAEVLRPMLASPDTKPVLKQGILFGLIRCDVGSEAYRVIAPLDDFDRPRTRGLALLLLAKHTDQLSPEQLEALGLLVRGGGLRGPLRVQAAWRYLKMTDQVDLAFTRVMEE